MTATSVEREKDFQSEWEKDKAMGEFSEEFSHTCLNPTWILRKRRRSYLYLTMMQLLDNIENIYKTC